MTYAIANPCNKTVLFYFYFYFYFSFIAVVRATLSFGLRLELLLAIR